MLSPDTRVMLTDALRPPEGCRVDIAVGTTYTLNLTALLLAPLSFALFDQDADDGIERIDPVKLLEAVRRHSEHTTVFCHAGSIHVPDNYQPILSFVEDSVREVAPPKAGAIFHPKVWALRFVDRDGMFRHRVVVLSRNITFDRSWDTALRLDEDEAGTIDAAPAAQLVRKLPGLGLRQLSEDRQRQIDQLADTLSDVRLAAPAPFTEGALLLSGLGDSPWPFPERGSRVLAISPFLERGKIDALGSIAERRDLVSRPESFDRVGAAALRGWSTQVLQRMAEVEVGQDADEPTVATSEWRRGNEGLHAKTFVIDLADRGGESVTVTGSANLTAPGWGGNVEFGALLIGPTSRCGVAVALEGEKGTGGLIPLLENYAPASDEPTTDPAEATGWELERFHHELAAALPEVRVTHEDDDTYRLQAVLNLSSRGPGATTIRPVSLSASYASELDSALEWWVAPTHVTPFLVVETTAGEGDARAERRCVIHAALTGDVDSRRADNIFSILTSKDEVLRYLVFLLGDPSYDDLLAGMGAGDGDAPPFAAMRTVDIALLEPLVRAVGRDEDALMRVASLMDEIRERTDGADLVPDGFQELWDVVWPVHQEESS